MKVWFPVLILHGIVLSFTPSMSQVDDHDITYLDEGTEFYFGFLQNEEQTSFLGQLTTPPTNQLIFLTSRFDCDVEVQFNEALPTVHRIEDGKTTILEFDGDEYCCIGDGICDRVFRVTSEFPIQVRISSQLRLTSEATHVLPVSRWGTRYFSMNYPTDWYDVRGADPQEDSAATEPRRGEFAIVAAFDSTYVSVRPSVNTLGGLKADSLHTRMLMAGEIWQVQDWGRNRGVDDLTGTEIVADRKVGVLTGHVRTGIPTPVQTKNHLLEFLPPVTDAGRLFHAAPLYSTIDEDRIRIVSVSDGVNRLTLYRGDSGAPEIILDTLHARGEFVEYPVSGPMRIESTHDVQVGQFSVSVSVPDERNGDPALVMLDPSRYYRTTVGFRPSSFPDGEYRTESRHFGSVIIRGSLDSSIYLDTRPLLGSDRILEMRSFPRPPGDTTAGYTWLLVSIEDSVEGSFLEGENLRGIAYVSGITQFDAYAMRAASPRTYEDNLPPQLQVDTECPATLALLTVTDAHRNFSAVDTALLEASSENVELMPVRGVKGDTVQEYRLQQIDVRQPGLGIVRLADLDGNQQIDTVEIGPFYQRVVSPFPIEEAGDPGKVIHRSYVTFRNEGDQSISVDSILFYRSRANVAPSLPRHVPAAGEVDLAIEFDLTDGSVADTMRIWAGCRWLDVPVAIEKVGPVAELLVPDFGDVRVGDTAYQPMTLRNLTATTLTFDSIRFAGTAFRQAIPSQMPMILGSQEEKQLLLCFTPDTTVNFRETVWIWRDDRITVLWTSLIGTGIDSSSSSVTDDSRLGSVDFDHSTGTIRISFPTVRSVRIVSVYNMLGERVFAVEPRYSSISTLRVPLPEEFAPGVYHVVIDSELGVEVHRFRVTR